jgi:hypothetical protein
MVWNKAILRLICNPRPGATRGYVPLGPCGVHTNGSFPHVQLDPHERKIRTTTVTLMFNQRVELLLVKLTQPPSHPVIKFVYKWPSRVVHLMPC